METALKNNFQELNFDELQATEGGLFPIVIAGITITKGTAIVAGIALAGFGIGVYVGSR